MGGVGWTRAHPPVEEMAWMKRAACRGADPRLFGGLDGKPTVADADRIQQAWVYCAQCPMPNSCLRFGIRDRASGVYGGKILVDGKQVSVRHLVGKKDRGRKTVE